MGMGMTMGEDHERLKDELTHEYQSSKYLAQRHYFTAYGVNILMVGCSIAATVMAAAAYKDWQSVIAILAAVPAALIGVNAKFKFEKKSDWYWNRAKELQRLLRQLEYEQSNDPLVREVSAAFSAYDLKINSTYPSFSENDK